MARPPTPRQVAREQTVARIKELALAQLAESGATELSLRAIARDLGLVSSAIYRYYAGRDELITALIVDAYADLADALEAASAPDRRGPRRRWEETCAALRSWALAQPHRFSLLYGSAIPGYRAPADTIEPATRVLRALLAAADGAAVATRPPTRGQLRAQLDAAARALATDHDEATLLVLVAVFAQLVGLVTLEIGGHFVGGFEPADDLYAALVLDAGRCLGL